MQLSASFSYCLAMPRRVAKALAKRATADLLVGNAAVDWCFAKVGSAPDDRGDSSSNAVRTSQGTEPATLADFEAEYGPVRGPDGEG